MYGDSEAGRLGGEAHRPSGVLHSKDSCYEECLVPNLRYLSKQNILMLMNNFREQGHNQFCRCARFAAHRDHAP